MKMEQEACCVRGDGNSRKEKIILSMQAVSFMQGLLSEIEPYYFYSSLDAAEERENIPGYKTPTSLQYC